MLVHNYKATTHPNLGSLQRLQEAELAKVEEEDKLRRCSAYIMNVAHGAFDRRRCLLFR